MHPQLHYTPRSYMALLWTTFAYFVAATVQVLHELRSLSTRLSQPPADHPIEASVSPKASRPTEKAPDSGCTTQKSLETKHPRPLGIDLDVRILQEFLKSMKYDMTDKPITRNSKLEATMVRVFESRNLEPQYLKPVLRLLPLTCAATEMPYYNHPFDVKVYITTYTTLFLYIDDACERYPSSTVPELARLVSSFGNSGEFENPNLSHFLRHVTEETPKFFGPYSTGAIIKSTIDFFCGCIVETKFPQGLNVPSSSSRFPRYLRLKTGCSEAYAHMIFPSCKFPEQIFLEKILPIIPDIIELTDMVNDILSFYKESVVGSEQNTFFMNSARLLGCDPVTLIRGVCCNQVNLARDVINTLAPSREDYCLDTFLQYLRGYLMWHCAQKRYRLSEIGICLGGANDIS
jgi:hypothetical protein